jgi:hypothetical protein
MFFCYVVPTVYYTSAELLSNNTRKKGYNLLGGAKYVALYIQLTIWHNNLVRPFYLIRTDKRKSAYSTSLNFLYNGATTFN